MSQGLYTAVSGIKSNQTRLTVIANNIANVNTTAFKASAVNFKTVFADTISAGTRPNTATGGTNPKQRGNGVTISDMPVNFAQGGTLFTGRNTDFSISGEGFFTIEEVDQNGVSGYNLTRAGNFTLDAEGGLVTASGNRVMGTRTVDGNNPLTVAPIQLPRRLTVWKEVDAATGDIVQTWIGAENSSTVTVADLSNGANTLLEQDVEIINFSVGSDGAVSIGYSNSDRISVQTDPSSTNTREIYHLTSEGDDYSESGLGVSGGTTTVVDGSLIPEQIQLRLATVANPEGLIYEGDNNWSIGANSGDASFGIGNTAGRGIIEAGALESSNVDISKEFTDMIISQRGLEAASKAVSVQSEVLRTIIGMI